MNPNQTILKVRLQDAVAKMKYLQYSWVIRWNPEDSLYSIMQQRL